MTSDGFLSGELSTNRGELPPGFERDAGPLPRWLALGFPGLLLLLIASSFVTGSAIPQLILLPLFAVFAVLLVRFIVRRRRLWQQYGVPTAEFEPRLHTNSVNTPAVIAPQNTLAVVAFVLAFFFSVPAIVCGHIALVQISRTRERGKGLAIAALVLGYVSLAALAAFIIFLYSQH